MQEFSGNSFDKNTQKMTSIVIIIQIEKQNLVLKFYRFRAEEKLAVFLQKNGTEKPLFFAEFCI